LWTLPPVIAHLPTINGWLGLKFRPVFTAGIGFVFLKSRDWKADTAKTNGCLLACGLMY
jgi:hypothetical protein